MDIKIKSNRHTRPLYRADELPTGILESEFDYVELDSDGMTGARFFNYRGSWYDFHEFELATAEFKSRGFDGVQTESYFSAVVVCYFDADGHEFDDEIIVGYAHW